jgi:hypothetical protein
MYLQQISGFQTFLPFLIQLVPIFENHDQVPDNWNLLCDTWKKMEIGSKFIILELKM